MFPKEPVPALNGQSDKPSGYQNGHHKSASLSEDPIEDWMQGCEGVPIKARVFVQIDGKSLGEHLLNKPILTISRYPTSDIQIPSQRVSRFHAIIRWKAGAWVIEDADSLNGLTCQGQIIDQLALVDGDCIYIDPTIVLQYEELGQ